jgi:signal transduction histidine kinase
MIKDRLVYKISVGYVIIVLICLMIVGSFFIKLFKDYSYHEKETNMLSRAREITQITASYLAATVKATEYHRFIELLDSFSNARVWVTDANGDMVYMSHQQQCRRNGPNVCIGQNADRDLIEIVLQGKEVIKERYSNFYNEPMIVVGTPIYNHAQILGAVFLHAPIIGITATMNRAYQVLLLAILVAIALIGVLGIFYSRQITKPLHRMNITALEMAEGNYAVRTNIKQQDEVGQLSSSIDYLASKLGATISELERLEQMRKDLISNVSHEFRTPLTLIRGSVETLIDRAVTDQNEVQKQYQRIFQETKGLERLVNDLLDVSRLQSGKFDLQLEDLDLGALVAEVATNVREIAAKKQIVIVTEIQGNIPPVPGDYYRLRQLLVIFLDNAIKYSDNDTKIRIALRFDQAVIITIQDQGMGIPPEELPYIWERFYKVDKARVKTNSGAGLGLTIAKYLIEAHHGSVTVVSRLGEGTTIEIKLPTAGEKVG